MTVKADDGNDGTDTIVVTISVTDVAEQPSQPAAPTVSAVPGSSTSLTATWSAPGLNGGPALIGYEVEYRAGSGTWTDFDHTGTGVTTTITGLMADTSYQVRVQALNGETPSDWSNPSTAVSTNAAMMINNAPAFSDGTTATRSVLENSAGGIDVGAPVTATDADADTLAYTLEGTDAASFTIVSGTGQIKTVTGVTYDHEATQNSYSVTVKADDGNDGTGTIAVTINVTDVAEQPSKPEAPTVSAVPGSATSLTANWVAPNSSPGPALIGYEVEYRAGSTGTWTGFDHAGTGVTTTITGLMAGTSYQVRVQALNGETPSDWSSPSTAVRTNDLPELSVAAARAQEGNALTFTVTLSATSTAMVSVSWATASLDKAGDDAVAGTDYTAGSGTLTFSGDEKSKTVMVSTDDDALDEADTETFTLTLSNAMNAALSNGRTTLEVIGTIEDNDDPPVVSVAPASATEGAPVEFTVRLSAASGRTVTVLAATSIKTSDTATTTDFTAVSRTLTFNANETSKTVTVQTREDTTDEENETFTLTLSSSTNAALAADPTAKGTITDDDAEPTLSVADATGNEGSAVTFTVTLSAASGRTVSVRWATASLDKAGNDAVAGTDYTAGSGTLTFGANETSKQVMVTTLEDALDEEDETFTLTLSNPANAALSNGQTTLEVLGTIEDDDALPELSVQNAASTEGGDVRFTVRLSAASGKEVTVGVRTSIAGTDTATTTDFTATTTTLTFAPGDRSKTVPVATDDDALDEADEETFTLTLSNPTNATLSATNATAVGTIRDNDDKPRITIGVAQGNENTGVVVMPLTLNEASSRQVTAVWYVNTGGSFTAEDEDFTVTPITPRTVTFAPGSQNAQIRVALVDDTTDEPDETFQVQLGQATNATFASNTATGTIEDDDGPPTISIADDVRVGENERGIGTFVGLTIQLSEASEKTVRFKVRRVQRPEDTATDADLFDRVVHEDDDILITPGTMTDAGTPGADLVGLLYVNDDDLDEPDETFTLEIHAFRNATTTAGVKTEATVTIEDDDPEPTVSVEDATATEGAPVAFTVRLSAASGKTVTVLAATSVESGDTAAASDFAAVSETLTFLPGPPAQTSKTVTVRTEEDTTDEADEETFTLTLSGASNAALSTTASTTTGTIVDDDDAPEVTLVLTPSSIDEDGGPTTVTAELSNPSSEATTVTVSAAPVSPAVAGDFALSANRTLTIAAGATTTTGVVTIEADDNDTDAPDRRVTVSATATNRQGIEQPDNVTLTIEDDEAPPLVTLSLSATSTSEKFGTTVATASLTHPSSATTTVMLTPAPGDWTADGGGELTIPAGATASDGSVTLTAVDDDTDAPDKALKVTATAANTQGVNHPAGVELSIEDDEAAPTPTLSLSSSTIREDGVGGPAEVSVRLSHPSSEATTVTVTAAGADPKAARFTLTGATLTVPAGRIQGSSTAMLTATNNDTDAPDQRVTVSATATNGQGIKQPDNVPLTIADDELSPTVMLILSADTIPEVGGEATATVTAALSHPSSEATTVTVSAAAVSPAVPGDFVLSGSVLTIAAEAMASTGTVTVGAVDNDVDAADKRVTVSAKAANTQGLAGTPADESLTITDDDVRGLVFSPEALTIPEHAEAVDAYTVALTSEPTADVTLTVTSPDALRLLLSDFTATETLTFAPGNWDVAQAITLQPVRDEDSVTNTVPLGHAASGGDYGSVSESYPVTLTDVNRASRNIELSVDPSQVPEGDGAQPLTVTARLDGAALTSAATVSVTVGAGTATSTDFTALPATFNLTIAPDGFSASRTVTLTPVDDALVEGPETVTVSGTTTATQEGTTTLLGVSGAQVTIADDDTRGVTVSAATLTVPENASETYTVVLDSEPTADVTVTLTVEGDRDVTVPPEDRTLTFTADDWDEPQTVTVSAADDDDTTNDDATVTHTVTGADYESNNVMAASVTVTVTDDDTQGVTVSTDALTVPEGGSGTYTVGLDFAPAGAVTVTPSVTGNPDVTVSPADLTFTASDWRTPRTVTVTAREDTDSVDDTATVTHAVSGGPQGLTAHDVTVTVTDKDEGSTGIVLTLSPATVPEEGGARTVTVTAALDTAALTADAVVNVRVIGGTGEGEASAPEDFTADPAALKLRIRAGTTTATGMFDLTPINDSEDEGDGETVAVTGTTTATQEGATTVLEVTGALLLIADNDNRGVTVTTADPLVVAEGASATYTVVLDSAPTADVTVTLTVEGDRDVTVPLEDLTLTFTASTWSTPQTVTVSASDDDDTTGEEATVTHTVAGADYGPNNVMAASVTVTVTDDDTQGVTVMPTELDVDEGGSATYTVVLDFALAPTDTVTVSPSVMPAVAGDTDVTVSSAVLTFTASTWSTPQTVTVTALEDTDTVDDIATVTHAVMGVAELMTASSVSVVVTDNDKASRRIALTLSPETVPEEGGARTVTVTATLDGPVLTEATVVDVQVGGGTGEGEASATDDFTADPAELTLTIQAGTTEATGMFVLTPINDAEDEGDGETVSVTGTVSGLPVTEAELFIEDDDGRGLTVSRTALTVNEGRSVEYTVRLASQPTGPVRVTVSVTDNPDVTVMPEELEFTTASWNVAQEVTVEAADDPDGDNETATVTHAASGGGYDGLTGSPVKVTVRDNDRASRTVQLTVDPATVEEDGGPAEVTVTARLDGAARAADTEIELMATGGTAESGTDFEALSGVFVTILANETASSTVVRFVPMDDSVDEGLGETVVLGGSADGLTVRTATLTIADNDGRGIKLPEGPVTLTEGGSTTYRVALDTKPTDDVTVRVTVSGNPDVTVEPSSLPFTADTWDTEQTVTVSAAHDDDAANDTAELRHAASGADYARVTALPLAVAVTDDDTRGVTVSQTALTFREGSEATYEVVLDTQPTGTVTVTPTVTGDADVTVSPSSLRFTTSSWSRAQTVTVRAAQDLDQAEDRATVEHAVTGADYGEESVTAEPVGVTVTDDDVPSTTINLSVSPETVGEGAGSVRLTVTAELDASPEMEDTVLTLSLRAGTAQVSDPAAPGDDFAAVADVTLTIAAGESREMAQVMLAPVGDDVDEDDETVQVAVTRETVRDGLSLSSSSLVVTIVDDDTRGVRVSPAALTVLKGGEDRTYDVVLTSQPTDTVTVTVTVPEAAGGASVTASTSTLTFVPNAWSTPQTVTVTAMEPGDAVVEVMHTVSGGGYKDVTVSSVEVMVPGSEDKATRTVTLLVPATGEPVVTVPEGTLVPAGVRVTFRSAPTGGTVTFQLADNDPLLPEPPQGFRAGGAVVDITLEGGASLPAGGATVCLPTEDNRQRVHRWDNSASPPAWVELKTPAGGSPRGLACGDTDDFSLFALFAAPRDDVAPPKAWLARFGRTVAEQVVDALQERLAAPRDPGLRGTIAGYRPAAPDEKRLNEHSVSWPRKATDPWHEPRPRTRSLAARELLSTSRFAFASDPRNGGGSVTVWGQGAHARFAGHDGDAALDGQVTTATLGADWRSGPLTAGLALSHSDGEGSWSRDGEQDKVNASLTGLYPYAGYRLSERLSVWGAAGHGRGDLSWPDAKDENGTVRADTRMNMLAAGARGELLPPRDDLHGLALALKADGLWQRMGADGTPERDAVKAETGRVRLALESSLALELGEGWRFLPNLELGLRHDRGDAETGAGLDMGAGFALSNSDNRLSATLKARRLLAHDASGFDDWGLSGAVRFDPSPASGRGFSLSLRHAAGGPAANGADALFNRETMPAPAARDHSPAGSRLEAETGWGFAAFDGRFTGTPHLGFGLTDTGRNYKLGWRLTSARRGDPRFEIGLDATRRETADDDAEHGIVLRSVIRW